ncbi:MAG: SHOCT domain-containing protein [Thermoleophilia bacterium]|nr:SHOCT domain-containing protein [Thermoleophilia bacterium]MDH3724844.1 SHOCT domain-containing protein [Thermoleophilia bacterium]
MPELLRVVARTAVEAGTATAVSGRVQRRQAEKYADRNAEITATRGAGYAQGAQAVGQPPPQQPPPPQEQSDSIAQLKQLGELKDQGILTDEEFAAKQAQILGI